MNWVIIDPGNGLLPVRRQAISRISDGLLSTGLLETIFREIWIEITIFIQETVMGPFCPG